MSASRQDLDESSLIILLLMVSPDVQGDFSPVIPSMTLDHSCYSNSVSSTKKRWMTKGTRSLSGVAQLVECYPVASSIPR